MTLIKLTHANHKSALYIARDLIAGYYFSPGSQCTHVVASGGAVFPALESVDEVARLLTASTPVAAPNAQGGAQNGKN